MTACLHACIACIAVLAVALGAPQNSDDSITYESINTQCQAKFGPSFRFVPANAGFELDNTATLSEETDGVRIVIGPADNVKLRHMT